MSEWVHVERGVLLLALVPLPERGCCLEEAELRQGTSQVPSRQGVCSQLRSRIPLVDSEQCKVQRSAWHSHSWLLRDNLVSPPGHFLLCFRAILIRACDNPLPLKKSF